MYYGILVDDPFLFYPLPGYFLVVGGGGRGLFPILKVQSKYRQACENLVTPGANDITEKFLKSSKFRPEVEGPCEFKSYM